MKDIRKKTHESLLSESVEETLNRIGIITEMAVPLKETLEKMLVKDYDYNDPYMINRIIIGKFHEEKITDVHQINSVCECFANSIDNLINAISDDDIIIDDYVKDTFELEE